MEQSQLFAERDELESQMCNWVLTTEQDSAQIDEKERIGERFKARRDEGHGSG